MKILRQIITLSFCLLFTGEGMAELPQPPKGLRFYEIGKASDFTLPDIDGETIRLSDFRGRWVFLHFWASWCGPCRKEMPTINKLASSFSDQQLKIIMINTAEDEDTIFTFLGEISMDLPVYMDRDGVVTEHWKPRGLPTTFLIDPEGYVRYQAIGGRAWHRPEFDAFFKKLLTVRSDR